MVVGLPTIKSHDRAIVDLLGEAASIFVNSENTARLRRIDMAAGTVDDDLIANLWQNFASWKIRLDQIRRAPDFHDEYARYRGLSYTFNCTDDVNAATDKIINLPDNHKFKTDNRVEFRINEGALPGGLSEATNYFIRTVGTTDVTITTTEGGGADVNLTNGTGQAEMLVNIKPDYASLRTAVDAVLTEIETNLTQRAPTYVQASADFSYSTRSTVETATLRTKLTDVENLIDTVAA